MIYEDDLDVFFRIDDFAIEAEYKNNTIKVIFDKDYKAVSVHDGEVGSFGPVVTCKTSDVQGIIPGDELKINGTSYYVKDIQPDDSGLTILPVSSDGI